MDEVGLGKKLQDARKGAGLTQQDLCQRAGLSYSTLAKIERGAIKAPSIFTIQSIAVALGLTLGQLLGETVPTGTSQLENPKKTSKSGVRFVYFDINGCFVRFFHAAFTELAAATGASSDVIETTFWHYNDAVCRGEMSIDDLNKVLAEALGVTTPFNWKDYYMRAVEPITEMHQLATWAAEHYHVGLLSNIMPGFIDEMLAQGLIPRINYKSIIDSSKTGAIKPEQAIYEAAQHYAEVQPNEILLVDDSRANIMAAEKMGWKVLWFDDFRPEQSADRVRQALEFDDNPTPS